MNWKNELIASAEEAEDFLRRQLVRPDLPALIVECNRQYGLNFCATSKDDERANVLSIEIETGMGVTWHNINIDDKFRGKGFGVMATKCALGLAFEHKESSILLSMVRHDGMSFWPTLGALPKHNPRTIGRQIKTILEENSGGINTPSKLEIRQIIELSEENSFAAWRKLSQTTIRLMDGRLFKHLVFERTCSEDNLEIKLDNPETLVILRNRLGAIPDFIFSETKRPVRFSRQSARSLP